MAAAGAGGAGAAALVGLGLGVLLFQDFSAGLAHLAAGILIFTAAAAFRGTRIARKPAFAPTCAGAMYLAVKLAYLLQSPAPLDELFPCLTAVALAVISAWLYAPLLQPGEEPSREKGMFFLAVTALSALTDVTVSGVSAGRAAVSFLVLAAAWREGAAVGTAAGLFSGLLMDLCAGSGTLFFAAAYGFAGLLAGSRSGKKRLSAAGCWLAAVFMLLLPMQDAQGGPLLAESLLAVPPFLLIPARVFGGKRLPAAVKASPASAPETSEAPPDGLKRRLAGAAAAFRALYDSMGRGAPDTGEENPAAIFDRAAERVCRGCALCDLCWKKEYVSTFNALNDATPFLLERGRALPRDFPRPFADRCVHLQDFLGAVSAETSAFLLRRQYRRQLEETRRSARGQYAELSELLTATAASLGEARAASGSGGQRCRIGAALRPKEGESVCGDSIGSFETSEGLLCLMLSDGCGSGEAARRESALTLRLLRQFLEAGIETEAALRTMNSALALRGAESGSFSTVDLLTLRPGSGEATVYKYGAAPTYLKRNGSVRRITGGTLPVGLRTSPAAPDVTRLKLEGGTFAVMVSDGVADAAHDEWLQNLLAGWEGDDPQTLAGLVLAEAGRQNGPDDDRGVQVLWLPPAADAPRRV